MATMAVGALTVAGCGSGGGGGSEGDYKIGLIASQSGVFAAFGDPMLHGAQLAVDEVNAEGGIGGRQISLVTVDDKSDATVAASQARRLLTDDQVDLLVGTVASDATLAVIPLVNRAQTTFIYPVTGEDRTCTPDGGTNPFVFGLGDTPDQQQAEFVKYAVENFGKNWYLLGNDYVFPRSVLEVTKKYLAEAGGTVVEETYTPLGTTDYRPTVRNMAASNADVIFAVVPGSDGNAFMKQATEAGLDESKTVTGVSTFEIEIYSGMAGAAEGITTADRYTDRLDTPLNKAFVDAYRELPGDDAPISATAAYTYSAVKLAAQAAKDAGSTDPEKMRTALESVEMDLPQGSVKMNEDHLLDQPVYVLKIENDGYSVVEDLGVQKALGHSGCSVK
jgi:urea transport system substrate-binding protein